VIFGGLGGGNLTSATLQTLFNSFPFSADVLLIRAIAGFAGLLGKGGRAILAGVLIVWVTALV
jgi:hypothetical protein